MKRPQKKPSPPLPCAASGKQLSPEAKRALLEAESRRAHRKSDVRAGEKNGPQGPEPTRYGDWERRGIASDF